MSHLGYYVHIVDMSMWLNAAQKAVVTKNRVRKELWSELVDIIHWDPIESRKRNDYFRLSQSAFVAIQTFCLAEGKGSDNLSSDQILNWATTLADLRARVPVGSLQRIQQELKEEVESETVALGASQGASNVVVSGPASEDVQLEE